MSLHYDFQVGILQLGSRNVTTYIFTAWSGLSVQVRVKVRARDRKWILFNCFKSDECEVMQVYVYTYCMLELTS